MLRNDGQEIVIPAFAGHSVQHLKGVQVATDESLETLTMGELDVEHPAVSLGQDRGERLRLWRQRVVERVPKWPQSTSKRSAGPGSMRTKARGGCAAPRNWRT